MCSVLLFVPLFLLLLLRLEGIPQEDNSRGALTGMIYDRDRVRMGLRLTGYQMLNSAAFCSFMFCKYLKLTAFYHFS